jgi:hypothetical protein
MDPVMPFQKPNLPKNKRALTAIEILHRKIYIHAPLAATGL